MRKLWILVLITVLSLSACTLKKSPESGQSGADTVPEEPGADAIRLGMTYDDIAWTDGDPRFQQYFNYLFCETSDGKNMVAEFGRESQIIEKIEVFPAVQPESEAFSAIQEGMNLFDVVEKVGIPTDSVTFGLATLNFDSADGSVFCITFDYSQMSVIDVCQVDAAGA